MIQRRAFQGLEVVTEQRFQTIVSNVAEPDRHWRTTDSNGHVHAYVGVGPDQPWPTLEYVMDERHWCNGDEGIARHDPHWCDDRWHWECRQCRERVKPGFCQPPNTHVIPAGPPTTTVDVAMGPVGVRPTWIKAMLTPDESARLDAAIARADTDPFAPADAARAIVAALLGPPDDTSPMGVQTFTLPASSRLLEIRTG